MNSRRGNDGIWTQTWAQLFAAALFLMLAGCASLHDTTFSPILPRREPEPWRVAVLPPLVAPHLLPENLKAESDWYERIFDGRGAVVTSPDIAKDAALALATTLTIADRYRRVVLVKSLEEAGAMGATHALIWTVHDYRSILRGANPRGAWMLILGPLAPQYWIRWLTLEGKLDWDVEILDLATKQPVFAQRQARSYFKTVRYAQNKYLMSKMLGFLRFEACPEFVCDLFAIEKDERVPGQPAEPWVPENLPPPAQSPEAPAPGEPVEAQTPTPAPSPTP